MAVQNHAIYICKLGFQGWDCWARDGLFCFVVGWGAYNVPKARAFRWKDEVEFAWAEEDTETVQGGSGANGVLKPIESIAA